MYTCWEGLPGLLPCGPQQRKEAIWDILSSLRNHLHRQIYPTTSEEDAQGSATESWSRSRRKEDLHEEALQEARVACQRVLEAVQVLESDIKGTSWGLRDVQYPHPCSHSSSWPWIWSLDRHPRFLSRHQQDRRVTFWKPEVELDPEERPYRGPLGCSSRIYPEDSNGGTTVCLKALNSTSPGDAHGLPGCQRWEKLPAWAFYQGCWNLAGLAGPLDGYAILVGGTHLHSQGGGPKETSLENPCLFFQIQQLDVRPSWAKGYTAHPAPKCITRNLFLLNDLSYQDIQKQPFLLTMAYAQGLQYWA